MEYKLVQKRKGFFTAFGLGLCLATTDIAVEKEEWVYPGISFIAEIGGALGMFLGFSFIWICDWLGYWILRIKF